jgi:hypothetical protein
LFLRGWCREHLWRGIELKRNPGRDQGLLLKWGWTIESPTNRDIEEDVLLVNDSATARADNFNRGSCGTWSATLLKSADARICPDVLGNIQKLAEITFIRDFSQWLSITAINNLKKCLGRSVIFDLLIVDDA